jgi:cytochrome b involved in lipid metabolism
MDSKNKIKMSEFKQNNGEVGNKLWVLIDNKVYDLTEFGHPGGNEILMDDHGIDRLDEFESIHSPAAKKQMVKFLIGEIDMSKDEGDVEDKKTKQIHTDKKIDEIKIENSYNGFLFVILVLAIVGFIVFKLFLNKN